MDEQSDGTAVFTRAQAAAARTRALQARVSVHGLIPLERSATVPTAQLPLGGLQLVRWVRNPRTYDCGPGLECARGELDVDAALRDLRPVLPELPVDPHALHDATVDVALASDGSFRRARLTGRFAGAHVEATVTPA
jgi:hypothetical protein